MGNQNSVQRMNFEDIQHILKNKETYCLINTLPNNKQECLIPNTVSGNREEAYINELLNTDLDRQMVIYGANTNDLLIHEKYDQLFKLGFKNISIYPGGMFEWLCLQDIYSDDLFPTTKKELDILKYKPESSIHKSMHYLTNY
jgi:hypothetical protein